MLLPNEHCTDAPYRLLYITEENPHSPWLCVAFASEPSQAGASRQKKPYPLYKTVSAFPCNQLYIRDVHDEGGCCCLCEHLDFGVADAVCRLIETVCEKQNIQRDHLIMIGNADGGSAALYFGLRMQAGHVIVQSPNVQIGTVCSTKEPDVWKYMVGPNCDRDMAVSILDRLIPDLLPHAGSTRIHLPLSPDSRSAMLPLLTEMEKRDPAYNDITVEDPRTMHPNEVMTQTDYLLCKLFDIMHVSLSVARWEHARIVIDVAGRPQGDLCLEMFNESGDREYLFKLHMGRNELHVDRWGLYTPVLRYPISGAVITLRDRIMGGRQFTCKAFSFTESESDRTLHFCFDISGPQKFTFDWQIILGDDVMASAKNVPDATFCYQTAQNGVYTAQVTVRETATGRCALLRRRICVTDHASTRKCTDPDRMAALYALVEECRYTIRDGRIHVSLKTAPQADDTVSYAFALMRNKKTEERRGYRTSADVEFPLQTGTWRVKYYVKQNNECVTGITDIISVPDLNDRGPETVRIRKIL